MNNSIVVGLAARNADGLARIGRSILDMRGIRFVEGEETDAVEAETPTVDTALYEAKISELTIKVAELEQSIIAKDAEIVAAKAANYDLLTAIPIPDVEAGDQLSPDTTDEITPDDLFGDKD